MRWISATALSIAAIQPLPDNTVMTTAVTPLAVSWCQADPDVVRVDLTLRLEVRNSSQTTMIVPADAKIFYVRHAEDAKDLPTTSWGSFTWLTSGERAPQIPEKPGAQFKILGPQQRYRLDVNSGVFLVAPLKGRTLVVEIKADQVSNWSPRTWRAAEQRWRQIGRIWMNGYRAQFTIELPATAPSKACP